MKLKRFLALLLVSVMLLAAAGCSDRVPEITNPVQNAGSLIQNTPAASEPEKTEPEPEPEPEPENLRPNGSSYLAYQILVPGDGVGDHPAFEAAVNTAEALASIGITLTVTDPEDSSELQAALSSGQQDIWAAAWPLGTDPDLYPVYHSESIAGGQNYFHISDPAIDADIADALKSDNQAYRRSLYRQCIENVMAWAVEIPNYQRLGCILFNSNTVKTDTVTQVPTRFWNWNREIEKLEMNDPESELVVDIGTLTGQFNPWYAVSANDQKVVELTTLNTLTTDRQGAVVFNAVEGETRSYLGRDYTYTGPADISVKYNADTNLTTYTIKLSENITFADGSKADADDLIFSLYVLADPAYTGPMSLEGCNILGFDDYRTQSTPEIYAKYAAKFEPIYTAGRDAVAGDGDAAAAETLWRLHEEVWQESIRRIISYVYTNYLDFASNERYGGGFSAAEISASEGMKTAYAMAVWGFGTWDGDGKLTVPSGRVFDCAAGDYPSAEDFYSEEYLAYGGDIAAYAEMEDVSGADLASVLKRRFVSTMAASDPAMDGGVASVTGITRVDDYTVSIVTEGYSASAIYSICAQPIVPMEYYSAVADDYDYDGCSFGVVYGDPEATFKSGSLEKPMSSGAYVFSDYDGETLYLTANENYFFGAPNVKTVWLRETVSGLVAENVVTGAADCGEIACSRENVELVSGYNANGEPTGNAVTAIFTDGYVYGYIGLNADTVCVNGDPDSDESRYMRRAFATLLALYRNEANEKYFGDSAVTVQWPLAGSEWFAAPTLTGEYPDTFEAYCTDVGGNPIYTDEMTFEEREAAALCAALGFLEAAGFTVENGIVCSGPDFPESGE